MQGGEEVMLDETLTHDKWFIQMTNGEEIPISRNRADSLSNLLMGRDVDRHIQVFDIYSMPHIVNPRQIVQISPKGMRLR